MPNAIPIGTLSEYVVINLKALILARKSTS